MKAIGQYIIIDPINEEVKVNNFILSGEDKKNQRYRKGTILSCGHEVAEVLKSGDVVYYDVAGGFEMIIQDKAATIIRQRDVVSVCSV